MGGSPLQDCHERIKEQCLWAPKPTAGRLSSALGHFLPCGASNSCPLWPTVPASSSVHSASIEHAPGTIPGPSSLVVALTEPQPRYRDGDLSTPDCQGWYRLRVTLDIGVEVPKFAPLCLTGRKASIMIIMMIICYLPLSELEAYGFISFNPKKQAPFIHSHL